jgi:hypothetical protein
MKKKIGIIIDYTLRLPEFKECYTNLKQQILAGIASDQSQEETIKSSRDKTNRDFWINLHKTDSKNYLFYETAPIPINNCGDGFDYTWKKYFPNNDHRLKFLEDWSYSLFGQGGVIRTADVKLINVCQSKVCDVVLIDRVTHTRKVPNTLAFLSRAGIFIKEIRFVNQIEELEEMKKEFVGIYDPIAEPKLAIIPTSATGESSKTLLDFMLKVEKTVNKK